MLNVVETLDAYWQASGDADRWDEAALWLEERAGK